MSAAGPRTDPPEAWLWLEFRGERGALERLLAELGDTDPTGCEELPGPVEPGLRIFWPRGHDDARRRQEARQAARSTGVRLTASGIQQREDWLREWKKSFRPLRVSPRLWVCPPWERAQPGAGEQVVVLDQKRAFGTGHHPTTLLCLRWLDERIEPGDTLLDVGCGSAILAIASAKLGANRAVAIDSDPSVIDEALDNVRVNGVEGRVSVLCGEFAELAPRLTAKHVVANILAARLLPLLGRLAASLAGGQLMISGIHCSERDSVARALGTGDLRVLEARRHGEWHAFVCERLGGPGQPA